MAEMFDAIDRCPVPVIARVQGAALGGGMGLCAVSDLVIAEAGAKFGFTETRLGILPAVIAPVRDRQDRRDRMPARCFPAAGGSMPRARCALASCTRSSRARARWTPRSIRRSPTCWPPVQPPPAPPRRSCARCAACPMSRRAGTPLAGSPRSGRAPRARKACARSSRSANRHGGNRGDHRIPRTDPSTGRFGSLGPSRPPPKRPTIGRAVTGGPRRGPPQRGPGGCASRPDAAWPARRRG